jgi:hypothetical protein
MHLTSTHKPQPRPAARDFVQARRFALRKTPLLPAFGHPSFGRIDDNNNNNNNDDDDDDDDAAAAAAAT